MKINEFDPVIYPIKIWICIGYDIEELRNQFTQNDNEELQDVDCFSAFTQFVKRKNDDKLGVMIVFENKEVFTAKTIAHESAHAAKFVFEHIDADIRPHEPFEYLLGWIAGCCEELKK